MDRLKKIALLLSLVSQLKEKGSWTGETHIQKATYLLQEIKGINLNFQFILYKHGPFSFDLRDELTAIRADGLVGIKQNFPYGPSFYVTDEGSKFLEKLPQTISENSLKITEIADMCGSKDVSELERLATALYVTRENIEPENRAKRLNSLKPHISIEKAQEAINQITSCLAV